MSAIIMQPSTEEETQLKLEKIVNKLMPRFSKYRKSNFLRACHKNIQKK